MKDLQISGGDLILTGGDIGTVTGSAYIRQRIATALAVMIRPSNCLSLLPLGICFAGKWRQLAWWLLGGLPGGALQLWYNHTLYGNAFTTGYGDVKNVSHTIRGYEAMGVSSIFMEDQVAPKRCGHMSGKDVIPAFRD